MPSSQSIGGGVVQPVTGSQTSAPLQASLSLQYASFGMCWQTSFVASHWSIVQSIPSSQGLVPVDWQPIAASQYSTPLQVIPSLQRESWGAWVQVLAVSSHESTVHATLSSQGFSPAWQTP